MEGLFNAMLGIDNNARRQAEDYFGQLKVTAPRDVIISLVRIMTDSPIEAHRALGAVLLRGITLREIDLWKSLSVEDIQTQRSDMLRALTQEKIGFVQRKIIDTICINVKISEWPELLHAVVAMQSSVELSWKILSFQLLEKLAEYVGKFLIANYEATMSLIFSGLESIDQKTQCAAFLALVSITFEVDEPDQSIRSHFTKLPGLLAGLRASGNEDTLSELVTVLNRLVEGKPLVFTSCCITLLETLMQVFGDSDVDETLRTGCLTLATAILTSVNLKRHCNNPPLRQQYITLLMRLMSEVDDAIGGIELHTRPEHGLGVGDVDPDGGDNLAEFAAMCLETSGEVFPSTEILQICMSSASKMIQSPDWRTRRASLLVISLIADSTRESIQPYLAMLLDTCTHMFVDPHPRVKYCALHCISVLIEVFSDDGEDSDDEEVFSLLTCKPGIYDQLPQQVFSAIQANVRYSRIMYMGISALKLLFDPDKCSSSAVVAVTEPVIDACMQLMSSADVPFFVKEEVASLLGNISLLTDADKLGERFPTIVALLWQILQYDAITPDTWWIQQHPTHEVSILKGKTLECMALVGKAVGLEKFRSNAFLLLQGLVRAQQSGLDFSDPLASYIMQTCVRIAGVIGNEFESFMGVVLPIVLAKVSEEVSVEIIDEGSSLLADNSASSSSSGASGSYNIYKRGVGNLQILCDSAQVTDKEMAGRVLFQYLLDTPMLILPHLSVIAVAVTPNIDSLRLSETLAVVYSSVLSEVVKVYITYVPNYSSGSVHDIEFASLVHICVSSLAGGLEKSLLMHRSAAVTAIFGQLVDALRELLRYVWDSQHVLMRPECALSVDLMSPLVCVLRDAAAVKMKEITIDEDAAEDDENWDAIIDCLCWVIKLYADRLEPVFVSELVPICQAILAPSSRCPTSLVSFAVCCLVEGIDVMPNQALSGSVLLCPIFLRLLSEQDLAITCAYGVGVCAVKGGPAMDSIAAEAVAAVCRELARLSVGESSSDILCIKDNLLSSLFKLCFYRGIGLGDAKNQFLMLTLGQLPLTNDVFEARAFHSLLISIVDNLLKGSVDNSLNPEILVKVLEVIVQLATVDISGLDTSPSLGANLTFWNDQIVYPHAIQYAKEVVLRWIAASTLSGVTKPVLPPTSPPTVLSAELINTVLLSFSPALRPKLAQILTR